jgi:hypothetical protein
MPAQAEEETAGGRAAMAVIAAFTIARIIVATCIGLASGETYTMAIARHLDLSYYDHPPLHQWITHFGALAFGENVWARLPFIFLFSATSWLMFALTRDLFGPRAGLIAVFGLNSSLFFFVGAGFSLIPDAPLVFALAAAAFFLVRLFFRQQDSAGVWLLWLAVGFCLGLAGLAKYTAILFAVGLVLFMALSPRQRHWFGHPAPYLGALLCLATLAPVLVWNAQHGWVSFLFQLERAEPAHAKLLGVARAVIVEILALTPWVAAPLIVAVARAAWLQRSDERRLFLLCLALPTIVLFNAAPLWGATLLMHWPMPGWFMTFPLLGAYLDEVSPDGRGLRRWAIASSAALGALAALAVSDALTGWIVRALTQLPAFSNSANGRVFDPTFDASAWNALRDAPLLNPRGADAPAFIVASDWKEGGVIAVAVGPNLPVAPYREQRGMAYLNDAAQFVGKDAVIVLQEDAGAKASLETIRPFFENLGEPQRMAQGEGGLGRISLILVPAHRLKRPFPITAPDGRP